MKRVFGLVLVAVLAVFAADIVNGRVVPTRSDFSSFGDAQQFHLYDSLFTEILPILSAGRNTDAIDVDSARVATLNVTTGNATTGNISQVVADSLTIGGISISAIDTSGTDSLAFTIDGVKFWVTATSTE